MAWRVNAQSGGAATLSFRFAYEGSGERSGNLGVNGGADGSYAVSMPSTGAWNNWQTTSVRVQLQQGANDLVLLADSAGGLANIDSITITGTGVRGVGCAETPPPLPDGKTLAFPGAEGFGR